MTGRIYFCSSSSSLSSLENEIVNIWPSNYGEYKQGVLVVTRAALVDALVLVFFIIAIPGV